MLEKFQELLGYSDKIVCKESKKNIVLLFIKVISITIVLTLLINKFLIMRVNVTSPSMVPTLNADDKLLATRVYNLDELELGDIVVFYSSEFDEYMVKRLLGLPGDNISINKGTLYVNGKHVIEPYVKYEDDYTGEFKVPKDEYFFLGDNRAISLDSRLWNKTYISGEDIIGIVKLKIYPFKDIGNIK